MNLFKACVIVMFIVMFMFVIETALPMRYQVDGKRYLCWRIPSGQACVEVFYRAKP